MCWLEGKTEGQAKQQRVKGNPRGENWRERKDVA